MLFIKQVCKSDVLKPYTSVVAVVVAAIIIIIEPAHDKTTMCETIKDSDQPVHPCSLISLR